MNDEQWHLGKHPRRRMCESRLLRYGMALLLPVLATYVCSFRPVLAESPFFLFLAAVVLSAANGGLAPAFLTTALSAVLIRLFHVRGAGLFFYRGDFEGMERMGGFVLVALLLSSVVASLRREGHRLRESEERYRLLAETASDAIVVIDEQGEILYVNPVAEKIFGTDAKQLLGRNLRQILPGDGYQSQLTEMKHRLDTRKEPVAVQLPGLRQSGEKLVVEMTLGQSSYRGRGTFTAIIRDITRHTRRP